MKLAHIFVISWHGQHENAISIAHQVGLFAKKVTVVYSDENVVLAESDSFDLIRRPNDLFWEDKFKACLDVCGDDPMMVIHADCSCENWAEMVKAHTSALTKFGSIGVWAPHISGTYYGLDDVRVAKIDGTNINFVALTDGIVFALSPQVVDRMRRVKYGSNKFGWGIDIVFCVAAYATSQWVVVDESIKITHPSGSGYEKAEASQGMAKFLAQLTPFEIIQSIVLKEYVESRKLRAAIAN